MAKYNLGCGPHYLDGWVNVDLIDKDPITPDKVLDFRHFPWAIKKSSATELMASHVLEHFNKEDGYKFIAECHRILRRGGLLRLAVPDMDKFIYAHQTGDKGILGGYRWEDMNLCMGGDQSEAIEFLRHKYMYSFESLAYILEKQGFEVKRRNRPLKIDNTQYEAISLYVDAVKL